MTFRVSNGHVPNDVTWPEKSKSCPRYTWMQKPRKPLEIEAHFQRTTNRKWRIANRMATWLKFKMAAWRRFAHSEYFFLVFFYCILSSRSYQLPQNILNETRLQTPYRSKFTAASHASPVTAQLSCVTSCRTCSVMFQLSGDIWFRVGGMCRKKYRHWRQSWDNSRRGRGSLVRDLHVTCILLQNWRMLNMPT